MNAPSRFEARLASASHPAGIAAVVHVGATGLSLETAAGHEHWAWERLRVRPGSVGGLALEHAGSGDVLSFADDAVLAAIRPQAPAIAGGALAGRVRRAAHPLVILLAAAVLALAGGWLALPHAAAALARRVPVEWEERFGDAVLESLAPEAARVGDPQLTVPIERLVAQLAAAQRSPYRFRVVVAADTVINAFAAPGGRIVVNTGLIALTESPDQLAAVLAHEIEHVRRRHVTVSLFQRFSVRLLLAVVLGESGGAVAGASGIAGQLSDLSFSRRAELEADAGGVAILRAAGFDAHAMVAVLERMGERSRAAPLELLSTHPATPARVAALRRVLEEAGASGGSRAGEPGWNAVREAAARAASGSRTAKRPG